MKIPKLPTRWNKYLKPEFSKDYFIELSLFLLDQQTAKVHVFPSEKDIFHAFTQTDFDKIKVVILGQDPYHGDGQAHGLCFSVQKGVKTPPSLVNIYKELASDLAVVTPGHGNLNEWAKQGVFLLNTILTVEKSKAGSHRKKGWELFTDKVIQQLNEHGDNLVFILWGAPAQKKSTLIDETKHLILKAPHPSPLSSYRGFFGSKPFSKTNKYLKKHNKAEIKWQLKA